MPICRDRAISQLNSIGFDVVRLPRADIRPLDVIVEHEGGFARYGALPSFWRSKAEVPELATQPPGASIKSVTTSVLRGRIGLQAVVDVIGKVGLDLSGKHECSVQLIADSPVLVTCTIDAAANYIRKGEIVPDNAAAQYFYDDRNRAWLILEVIASNKLQIVVGELNEAEAKIAASEISRTLAADAEIANVTSSGNTITYNRKVPLVFGFKAAEIIYDGNWLLELPAPAGKKFLGSPASGPPVLLAGKRLSLVDANPR